MQHSQFERKRLYKECGSPEKSTTKAQLLVLKNYCLSHFHEKSGDLMKLRPVAA